MKIEIWSDPVCLFCYIGRHRLKRVLHVLGLENFVDLEWHSFILSPHFQPEKRSSILDFYRREFNISKKKARLLHEDFTEIVSMEGLEVRLDKVTPCNSYNSHRLLQMARCYHLQTELADALFQAYFVEGENFNNIFVLAAIGEKIGIPPDNILHMFEGSEYMFEVRRDMEKTYRLQLVATPVFFLDKKISFIGNLSEEQMSELIMATYQQYSQRHFL